MRLTVQMLGIFEDAAGIRANPYPDSIRELGRRVFSGHVAFLVHTRARWADAQFIDAEPTIQGPFISAESSWHKTAHQSHRDVSLPFLGSAVGVRSNKVSWAESWLEARRAAGLVATPGKPFMPCPTESGSFGVDALSTDEAGKWMRLILTEENVSEDLTELGAHSCKATLLSWAAKYGRTDRREKRWEGI